MPQGLPPMASGLFGYMGYDAVRLMEDALPDLKPDRLDRLPDSIFCAQRWSRSSTMSRTW